MTVEVTTVADDMVVLHRGAEARRYVGLEPDTVHDLDGVEVRTLPRAGGELLCRFATVNDVHFGETECGLVEEAPDIGPVLSSAPGEPPYPLMMNEAAVAEISAIDPAAVVAKGDLTTNGSMAEYEAFLAVYDGAFGERLHHVRGNHDAYNGQDFAAVAVQQVSLPGVTLLVLDTTIPGSSSGTVSADQLEWLADAAGDAPGRVVVFGHHHAWDPASRERPDTYFGIHPDASEALVDTVAAHPNIVGYFAGHTHRNRVRRFGATGDVPWAEVACVKDFPGAWAEYRVHEGGITQVLHRISSPEALAWTERTRAMFLGAYADYSFGSLDDRCFVLPR